MCPFVALSVSLYTYVSERRNNWDDLLPVLDFAYDDTVQASAGHTSSFRNIVGAHPRRPNSVAGKRSGHWPRGAQCVGVAAACRGPARL